MTRLECRRRGIRFGPHNASTNGDENTLPCILAPFYFALGPILEYLRQLVVGMLDTAPCNWRLESIPRGNHAEFLLYIAMLTALS